MSALRTYSTVHPLKQDSASFLFDQIIGSGETAPSSSSTTPSTISTSSIRSGQRKFPLKSISSAASPEEDPNKIFVESEDPFTFDCNSDLVGTKTKSIHNVRKSPRKAQPVVSSNSTVDTDSDGVSSARSFKADILPVNEAKLSMNLNTSQNGLDEEMDSDEEELAAQRISNEPNFNKLSNEQTDSEMEIQCSSQQSISSEIRKVFIGSPSKRTIDDCINVSSTTSLAPPKQNSIKSHFESSSQDAVAPQSVVNTGKSNEELTPTLTKSVSEPSSSGGSGSRKMFSGSASKKRAVYRHVWNNQELDVASGELNKGQTFTTAELSHFGDLPASGKSTTSKDSNVVSEALMSGGDGKDETIEPPKTRKFFKSGGASKLMRMQQKPMRFYEEEVTAVKCSKSDKELYTVVRNVKEAHQCHESGEKQEFSDDVDYLLKDLHSAPTNLKCLSIIGLASKCLAPQFRSHLKARGLTFKIFKALAGAYKEPSLAVCTATVLYILSRDRLGITVDMETLQLMVNLMRLNKVTTTAAPGDCTQKFREKCWAILNQWREGVQNTLGTDSKIMFDITRDNLTPSLLATEALVFTCIRHAADEQFKNGLRNLSCLDFVADELSNVIKKLDFSVRDTVIHLQRYLKIVEHSTFMCRPNQIHMITLSDYAVLTSCARIISNCQGVESISCSSPTFKTPRSPKTASSSTSLPSCSDDLLVDVLIGAMKVLCNLSNENELCCQKLGALPGFISNCLVCVMHFPQRLPESKRFDLLVLGLGLLINICERSSANRKTVLSSTVKSLSTSPGTVVQSSEQSALHALTELFLRHEKAAREMDEEFDSNLVDQQQSNEALPKNASANGVRADDAIDNEKPMTAQELNEVMKQALDKAGKHMENSMVASYTALLVGCVLQQNEEHVEAVKGLMPDGSLKLMISVLTKFIEFMELTSNIAGNSGQKSMSRILEFLEEVS